MVTVPREARTIEQFLDRLFKPGETICICREAFKPEGSTKWIPANSGEFGSLETYKRILEKKPGFRPIYNVEAGVWIRINPIKAGDESGNDSSASSFRHLLVEFDGRPKEEQWDIFLQSKLPISVVIDSGGKSLTHG